MRKQMFPCSQQELYTICRYGWNTCNSQLTSFSDFKAKYSAAFIAYNLNQVDDAAAKLDFKARSDQHEIKRLALKTDAIECCTVWKALKLYIIDAFPKDQQKIKFQSAGQPNYSKAKNFDWESINALMDAGSLFIVNHLNELTANQNMPTTFVARYEAIRNNFKTNHQAFLLLEDKAVNDTQSKLDANNAIYNNVQSMFKDAQIVFANNPTTAKQLTFKHALSLVGANNTAGIRGYITDASTHLPIAQATITIDNRPPLTTDKDGHYELLKLATGFYTIKVEAAGYTPWAIYQHEVKLGTVSKLNIMLTPIA